MPDVTEVTRAAKMAALVTWGTKYLSDRNGLLLVSDFFLISSNITGVKQYHLNTYFVHQQKDQEMGRHLIKANHWSIESILVLIISINANP